MDDLLAGHRGDEDAVNSAGGGSRVDFYTLLLPRVFQAVSDVLHGRGEMNLCKVLTPLLFFVGSSLISIFVVR
jgi:hypothetical protein